MSFLFCFFFFFCHSTLKFLNKKKNLNEYALSLNYFFSSFTNECSYYSVLFARNVQQQQKSQWDMRLHTLIKIADKRARITNKNDSQSFNASKDKNGSSLFNTQAHKMYTHNIHTYTHTHLWKINWATSFRRKWLNLENKDIYLYTQTHLTVMRNDFRNDFCHVYDEIQYYSRYFSAFCSVCVRACVRACECVCMITISWDARCCNTFIFPRTALCTFTMGALYLFAFWML